jgi:hypothetical protein
MVHRRGACLSGCQFAMVQPQRDDMAITVCRDRFPAAVAGCITARHGNGRGERPSAVIGTGREQSCTAGGLRRPHDHDRWIARAPRNQRNTWRLLAGDARLTGLPIYARRRTEGASAVATAGAIDIGDALVRTGDPHERYKLTGRRQRRVCVRTTVDPNVGGATAHALWRCRYHERRTEEHQTGFRQIHMCPSRQSVSNQKVRRTPNWIVLGSPTAVIWLNVDTGFVG